MSPRRSFCLIGSGPVLPLTTKGRLSFSAIKIFNDDENRDEFENEPVPAQDIPEKALPKPSLAAPDCLLRSRIDQPTTQSDCTSFGLDLEGLVNPSSNQASLHGVDNSISSYFDLIDNDGKFVESELEAVNRHNLPTPQTTPDPPSASMLTSDFSFIGDSRVDILVETAKPLNDLEEASAGHERLINGRADLRGPSQNLSHMQLEVSDTDIIMEPSPIGELVHNMLSCADDRKTPSPELLMARSDFTSSTTSNENMYEACPISKPARDDNHFPDLSDRAPGSSRGCEPLKFGNSSKHKRKKHKRKPCDEVQEIVAASLEESLLDQNRNSLAEYRRQMLGRHRRIDHRPARKSIFVTIRRDWYS